MQKGHVLLLIAVILAIAFSWLLLFQKYKLQTNREQVSPEVSEKKEYAIYQNNNLGFEFEYSTSLTVKEDSEEEFNKRGNGDFRKNFTYYVTYSPAKVLGAVSVLDKSASFDKSPFTVWVFENADNLTIDKWYLNFWYYPFVWGDYTERRNDVAPTKDATISGQLAKYSVVSYQPGSPKFLYLKDNGKMYLIRVINREDKLGDQFLSTFKFLN